MNKNFQRSIDTLAPSEDEMLEVCENGVWRELTNKEIAKLMRDEMEKNFD